MTIFNLGEEPLPKHYPVTKILNKKKPWKILEEFTQKEHEIILLFHSSPFDYTY